jgi:hypothetical protein
MTSFIKKPYCKVCQDAGKTEKEYTSHYVRTLPDRNGKTNVTCPTLLSTTCNQCGKIGHTTKFCQHHKNDIKDFKRNEYNATHKKGDDKKTINNKQSTIYNVLMESDEDIITIKPVTIKPVTITKSNTNTTIKPVSWANIAASIKTSIDKTSIDKTSIDKTNNVAKPSIAKRKIFIKPEFIKSWADWTDSDNDDEMNEMEEDLWLDY